MNNWRLLRNYSNCFFFLFFWSLLTSFWASLAAQLVKNPPAMQETWVRSLSWENPLEKGKATHSSILAWRTPWTVQYKGSQRVGHVWLTFTFTLLVFYLIFIPFVSRNWSTIGHQLQKLDTFQPKPLAELFPALRWLTSSRFLIETLLMWALEIHPFILIVPIFAIPSQPLLPLTVFYMLTSPGCTHGPLLALFRAHPLDIIFIMI